MTDEQKRAFLAELTELSRKHGIIVGGCGCCGSPWFSERFNREGRYDLDDFSEFTWNDAGEGKG